MLSISDSGIYDTSSTDIKKTLFMTNNKFVVNQDDDFGYLSSLLRSDSFGSSISTDDMWQFVNESTSMLDHYATVKMSGSYAMSIANNVFESTQLDGNYSVQINVDTDDDSCMASNKYCNFDLVIQSGDILSCKHNQLQSSDSSSCVASLGSLNISYTDSSEFINSSIVFNNSQSTVFIDDAFLYASYLKIMQVSMLHMFDIILSYPSLSYPSSYCALDCYQIMQENHSKIRQLMLDCDDATSIDDANIETSYETFSSFSAFAILFSVNSTFLYPGGSIQIEYSIVDKEGNRVSDYGDDLQIQLLCTDLNINNMMHISGNECDLCVTGLYVQGLTIDDVSKQYIIRAFVLNDTLLLSNNDHDVIIVTIILCPSGFGITGAALQCDECADGYFSIESNSEQCHECNDDLLEGIRCIGRDSISIDYNYWMNVMTQDNDTIIISSDCPNGYCCQIYAGCDYIQDANELQLCAKNRDPNIALCGGCLAGFSESFGSVACKICDRNHYEYLIVPICITFLFLIYLIYFDAPSSISLHANNKLNDTKAQTIVIRDDLKGIQLMLLKVIVYFYQGLLYILTAATNMDAATYFLLPILQIFNLSIEFGDSQKDDDGYCFIRGMNSQMEILLNLLIPILLITSLAVISCTKCKLKCCNKSPSHCTALWRAILIAIGSILAVLFKMLTCRTIIENTSVHYYFGARACYETTWFIALFMLIVILLLWLFLYIKLYKMDAIQRYLVNNNNLYTLVKPYKAQYWYWESVLLSRRVFLALFTIISIKSAPHFLNISLNVVLCFYLVIQVWIKPFKYNRANRLESICVFVLIVVLGYVNVDLPSGSFISILLSMFLFLCAVIIPGLILLIEICRVCKHLTVTKYSTRRLSKLNDRIPKHLSVDRDEIQIEDIQTTKHNKTNTANIEQ